MRWIRQWFERRHAARPVPWKAVENECGWSPQKAGEKAFVKMMTDHHMKMFRIQMEANLRVIEDQYKDAKRQAAVARLKAESQRAEVERLRAEH